MQSWNEYISEQGTDQQEAPSSVFWLFHQVPDHQLFQTIPFVAHYSSQRDTGMYTSIFSGTVFTVSQLAVCSFCDAFRGVGLHRIPLHLNTAGLKKPQPNFFVTGRGLKAG